MGSLQALQAALRDGHDPLCIDLYDQSAEAQLRSSNSAYLQRVPRKDAEALARLVKALAGLDPSVRRAQTGTFCLRDVQFTVNCCPQSDGEILVVRRRDGVDAPRRG